MLRYLSIILPLTFLFACGTTSIKEHSDKIEVESADFAFIDSLLENGKDYPSTRKIDVYLTIPDSAEFNPPYPAVVLLHSSWGLSRQEWYYANIFKRMGIATFSIDSFTARGVEKTSMDQARVSSASMLKDAYAVLNYIKNRPRFNPTRVAIMGFSKGGIVALYSAIDRIQQTLSKDNLKFAAHIAYYPWCGLQLHDMHTTGAPVLILGGNKDIVTPIQRCIDLVETSFDDTDLASITIKTLPSARHAFDHPVLAKVPFKIAMDAQIPANCSIKEVNPGWFIEEFSDTQVSGNNIGEVLQRCSKYKGMVKYNGKAARTALATTQEFLTMHLLNNYPQRFSTAPRKDALY